jgi:hypothetical protein
MSHTQVGHGWGGGPLQVPRDPFGAAVATNSPLPKNPEDDQLTSTTGMCVKGCVQDKRVVYPGQELRSEHTWPTSQVILPALRAEGIRVS